jgi:hypothetical protein
MHISEQNYQLQGLDPDGTWINIFLPCSSPVPPAKMAEELVTSTEDLRLMYGAPQNCTEFRVLDRSEGSIVHEASNAPGERTYLRAADDVAESGEFVVDVGVTGTVAELAKPIATSPSWKQVQALFAYKGIAVEPNAPEMQVAMIVFQAGIDAGRRRELERTVLPSLRS